MSVLLLWPLLARAEVKESDAINIIVGEAANQGFNGMVAVAEVIRRRNSTEGLYGLNAHHNAQESKSTWIMAEKAWKTSKTSNLTHGADHFENIKAFGMPVWTEYCHETVEIKDQAFFKCSS